MIKRLKHKNRYKAPWVQPLNEYGAVGRRERALAEDEIFLNQVITFPIKKRIDSLVFIDGTAALYILKTHIREPAGWRVGCVKKV